MYVVNIKLFLSCSGQDIDTGHSPDGRPPPPTHGEREEHGTRGLTLAGTRSRPEGKPSPAPCPV